MGLFPRWRPALLPLHAANQYVLELAYADFTKDYNTGTPVNTVWASAFLAVLLGLLTLINDAAAEAIFSVSVIGLYPAYLLPSVSRLIWGDQLFKPGQWHLGRYSKPIHFISVAFQVFIIIVFCFPSYGPDPTADVMNYACVVEFFVFAGCLVYYFLPVYGARHWFQGPISTIDALEGDDQQSSPFASTTVEGNFNGPKKAEA